MSYDCCDIVGMLAFSIVSPSLFIAESWQMDSGGGKHVDKAHVQVSLSVGKLVCRLAHV